MEINWRAEFRSALKRGINDGDLAQELGVTGATVSYNRKHYWFPLGHFDHGPKQCPRDEMKRVTSRYGFKQRYGALADIAMLIHETRVATRKKGMGK